MKVTFHHPPTGTPNPFIDFDPTNTTHYPTSVGVYIYGLKLDVGGTTKFVPQYVGTTYNRPLITRLLCEHYLEEKSTGKSVVAKFDFSSNNYTIQEILDRYNSMDSYDKYLNAKNKVNKIWTNTHLVYFQDARFYYLKNSLPFPNNNIDGSDFDQIATGGVLDQMAFKYPNVRNNVPNIKTNIGDVKKMYDSNYYYIYAEFEKDFQDYENHQDWLRFSNPIKMFLEVERGCKI